jgi:hypothetical protein
MAKEVRMSQRKDEALLKEVAARQRWREEDARVVVETWQRSGETLSEYAGRLGLRGERISRWWSKMEKSEERTGVSFHRVRVAGARDRFHEAGKIEVLLQDGRCVRVPDGFSPAELQKVLRVLEEEV